MDIKGFQVWLSAARGLTRAQRREALAVLSGRSVNGGGNMYRGGGAKMYHGLGGSLSA